MRRFRSHANPPEIETRARVGFRRGEGLVALNLGLIAVESPFIWQRLAPRRGREVSATKGDAESDEFA